MAKTITEVIQRVKTSVDNDSFLYQFKNSSWAEAYTRGILHEVWLDADNNPTDKTYYSQCISPRITHERVVNVYYKNTNGVWINYTKFVHTYPAINILTGAVQYEDQFKVPISVIPRCIFTDATHFTYYIDAKDGDYSDSIHIHYIDEQDSNKVTIQPYSLDDPTFPSTARHMMQDIKIRVKDEDPDTFLVWFNGVFAPIVKDNSYSDIFYIRNGMSLVDTQVYEQKANAPVNIQPTGTFQTATVYELPEYYNYRYNYNLRVFKWDNVSVSEWINPISTNTIPIIHNYSAVYIPNTLLFPVEVNTNAHMILVNGVVLDPSEYEIDIRDKRKVILKNVYRQGLNLLNEMIAEINAHPTEYINITPLSAIRSTLLEKTYSLVNFTSTILEKTLYLTYSKSCIVDFPYRHEITFSELNLGDLVLIDGTFTPYEWVHKYTIRLPIKTYTFLSENLRIREENVSRAVFSFSS